MLKRFLIYFLDMVCPANYITTRCSMCFLCSYCAIAIIMTLVLSYFTQIFLMDFNLFSRQQIYFPSQFRGLNSITPNQFYVINNFSRTLMSVVYFSMLSGQAILRQWSTLWRIQEARGVYVCVFQIFFLTIPVILTDINVAAQHKTNGWSYA